MCDIIKTVYILAKIVRIDAKSAHNFAKNVRTIKKSGAVLGKEFVFLRKA